MHISTLGDLATLRKKGFESIVSHSTQSKSLNLSYLLIAVFKRTHLRQLLIWLKDKSFELYSRWPVRCGSLCSHCFCIQYF